MELWGKKINLKKARTEEVDSELTALCFSVLRKYFKTEVNPITTVLTEYRDMFRESLSVAPTEEHKKRSEKYLSIAERLLAMEEDVYESEICELTLMLMSIELTGEENTNKQNLKKLLCGFAAVTGNA